MEMKDIKNEWVKIGKTSITVKNRENNGKTKGIVKDIIPFKNFGPNQMSYLCEKCKDRELLMGENYGKLIYKNFELYYLYSTSDLDVEKKCYDLGYDTSYLKRMEIIEKFKNAGIEVIPVWSF